MGRIFRFQQSGDREDQGMDRMPEPDTVTHPSPYADWFATQEDRSVLLCDKASDEKIKVEPPASWGDNWAWNVTEDGTSIVMRTLR